MKKTIRLTESDLIKLVKRVIKEQNQNPEPIDLMKTVYLRYKPLGREGLDGNKKFDKDVLQLQKYFNSTGQLGPDKKYNKLKEDGVFGQNTYWQINNTINAYDRPWWNKNSY